MKIHIDTFKPSFITYYYEGYITPSENDNQPTIEVYQNVKGTESWQECIWDNVNKDKQ